jgi:hypothetical protein
MNCNILNNELSEPVTSCSDWYAESVVQYATVHIPPVVLTCTQSSVYSTLQLQFIFHQLFWLVRRVRCIVHYSSYSTSCFDWYAEFVVEYSVYSTLQFIFHQLFWLVRTVRCTVLYSSYSTRNMNCNVLYNELCVPVRTTSGIISMEEILQLQFIFHQLFWLVRRVRCIVHYSSYSTSCSDWYAEFVVEYVTVHIPGGIWTVEYCTTNCAYVVLTGTQSSLYSTLQFIFHQLFWLVRRVRCPARYSSYFTNFPDYDNNQIFVPVRTTGGIWTVEYYTPNSTYQSEQLVEYEL